MLGSICILEGLNKEQKEAVMALPQGPLQIIAGPGTGKTKVLTSRVAYLLTEHCIPPQQMIVTTFTKNAAAEMVERLGDLVQRCNEDVDPSKLIIGTFHSVCVKILKKYGKLIGLGRFKIADTKDSNEVLKGILAEMKKRESIVPKQKIGGATKNDAEKLGIVRSRISSLKSKGIRARDYRALKAMSNKLDLDFVESYTQYEMRLLQLGLLDFDDLLLCTNELLGKYPKLLNYLQHVFVDEFQDTNAIQLELLLKFAQNTTNNNVTIVGDPNQSIYGFRDAVAENFENMAASMCARECPPKIIYLKENYRSTLGVLDVCQLIIAEKQKIHLRSQLEASFPVVFKTFAKEDDEVKHIVNEIKFLVLSLHKGLFSYNDVAILIRAASQSRRLEQQLILSRVPYRINKGVSFWGREEVSRMVDYLRVVASNWDQLAIMRTLNFPARGIGAKSAEKIVTEMEKRSENSTKVSPFVTLSCLVDEKVKWLSPKIRGEIKKYLEVIENSRQQCVSETQNLDAFAVDELELPDVMKKLLRMFDVLYQESGLLHQYKENEDAQQNIMEVRREIKMFDAERFLITIPDFIDSTDTALYNVIDDADSTPEVFTYLDLVLESIDLFASSSTKDKKRNEDTEDLGSVTISTIHGAKGLEWPVVYIPSLNENILPSYLSLRDAQQKQLEDPIEEERRIFYVAVTRAKLLLTMSRSQAKQFGYSGYSQERVSRFITEKLLETTVEQQKAFLSVEGLNQLYKLKKTIVSNGLHDVSVSDSAISADEPSFLQIVQQYQTLMPVKTVKMERINENKNSQSIEPSAPLLLSARLNQRSHASQQPRKPPPGFLIMSARNYLREATMKKQDGDRKRRRW